MQITDPRLNNARRELPGPGQARGPLEPTWRREFRQALFRDAKFFVDVSAASGGRRVAVHEYPKRNTPYAEDMARTVRTFQVQGFLIGRWYHEDKDKLHAALEEDGPGRLRLPMMYLRQDIQVMVQQFTFVENRETGGYCQVNMSFVEYGDPNYRQTVNTASEVFRLAQNLENVLAKFAQGKSAEQIIQALRPYTDAFSGGKGGIGSDFPASQGGDS